MGEKKNPPPERRTKKRETKKNFKNQTPGGITHTPENKQGGGQKNIYNNNKTPNLYYQKNYTNSWEGDN